MLAGIFLGLLLGLVYLGIGVFGIWFREPRLIGVGIFCIAVASVCFFFFIERCFLGWHKSVQSVQLIIRTIKSPPDNE